MIPFVTADDDVPDGRTRATRTVVERFVRAFYVDRDVVGAFETYVREDYVQHNPGIADGRAAAVAALAPMFAEPTRHFDLLRVIVDGDYAVVQLHGWQDGDPGGAVIDMYRFADGLVAEHWDVIARIPATSANPHPLL